MKTNKNANITQIRAHSLHTSHKVEVYDRCIYTSVLAEMAHGARMVAKADGTCEREAETV